MMEDLFILMYTKEGKIEFAAKYLELPIPATGTIYNIVEMFYSEGFVVNVPTNKRRKSSRSYGRS